METFLYIAQRLETDSIKKHFFIQHKDWKQILQRNFSLYSTKTGNRFYKETFLDIAQRMETDSTKKLFFIYHKDWKQILQRNFSLYSTQDKVEKISIAISEM